MNENGWIKNIGNQPSCNVDVKLDCDEFDWPGVDCVRYNQNPNDWEWTISISGISITHYRPTLIN